MNNIYFKNIAAQRALIAVNTYGIPVGERSYFSLDGKDYDALENFRKVCNFAGKNKQGRSRLRQFYYHLEKGWEIYKRKTN